MTYQMRTCLLFSVSFIEKKFPVRAIAGGTREIYFDNRIKATISKRMLSPSLALRQFTANKRQYAGVIVVALLVYFMTTTMVLANVITVTLAWEAMGIEYSNLDIEIKKKLSENEIKKSRKRVNFRFLISLVEAFIFPSMESRL